MATWYKVKWIGPLFAAFDALAPGRPKGSDGTIGDKAHQGSPSGHNPDDTPGSKPEREDDDSKPEVRAADVTTMSRMQEAINAILRTPADRDRFVYIIFRRRIWRKVNGWAPRAYAGSDPHTGHAHFSGDPDHDENGAPFTSILNLANLAGGDDMTGLDDRYRSPDGADRTYAQMIAELHNADYFGGGPDSPPMGGTADRAPRSVHAMLRKLSDLVTAQAAADAARDATMQAAITALAAGGPGRVESAPIIAAIQAAAAESRGYVERLQQDVTELRQENAALRQRLAGAFGSGSE